MIRLPKSTSATSFRENMKNFGSKVISLALNNSENFLIALTDTLQLVCYNFKGKRVPINQVDMTCITSS